MEKGIKNFVVSKTRPSEGRARKGLLIFKRLNGYPWIIAETVPINVTFQLKTTNYNQFNYNL